MVVTSDMNVKFLKPTYINREKYRGITSMIKNP